LKSLTLFGKFDVLSIMSAGFDEAAPLKAMESQRRETRMQSSHSNLLFLTSEMLSQIQQFLVGAGTRTYINSCYSF
jgi:hypothetical protein